MTPAIERMVARLWPDGFVRALPLAGGTTNSNFLVELADGPVVLRVPGRDTDLLGIDRTSELLANEIAARAGVAAPVVLFDEASGSVVTRFLTGRTIGPVELAQDPMLAAMADALRRVHHGGEVPNVFDPLGVILRHHGIAADRGVTEPFDFDRCFAIVERFGRLRPLRPTVLGHNDLLNGNLLYDGAVRLIDWEYAGMTDPYFDLANLSSNHDFSEESDRILLAHYFGDSSDHRIAVLSLMKLVSELREAMWAVVQMAISDLEVNFAAYAIDRAERFEGLCADMNIEELMELAGNEPSEVPR